eukprot:TRINITY_DN8876_c0_g1_i1.p1 TRINITY_DN8876_c0_g1~~TRINITY_DN8876_c0_g1_i1.p1  ORF type:complete len:137 (+),score=34.28 TRINITY_DN8876_c0_g1_i1:71-481(+)
MEQTRPVIAVDLDEVLGYFVQSLARWHNEAYGTTYTQSHFFSYTFKDVWGGTAEESTTKVHAFFESDYFQQQVAPVPGALEALQQLKQRYQLVIVTSRQHSIEEVLVTNGILGLNFESFFFSDGPFFGNDERTFAP